MAPLVLAVALGLCLEILIFKKKQDYLNQFNTVKQKNLFQEWTLAISYLLNSKNDNLSSLLEQFIKILLKNVTFSKVAVFIPAKIIKEQKLAFKKEGLSVVSFSPSEFIDSTLKQEAPREQTEFLISESTIISPLKIHNQVHGYLIIASLKTSLDPEEVSFIKISTNFLSLLVKRFILSEGLTINDQTKAVNKTW